MIITKESSIRINNKNIEHFKKLGYQDLKLNEFIKVPVNHLMKGSKIEIIVICDICGEEKSIIYKLYNTCILKHGFYSCNGKCSNIKRSKTNKILYGSDNWMQNKENYEKYKNIIFEKTGFDNVFKCPKSQENFRKTIMEKYGVSNLSHSEEVYINQQISGFSMKKHIETGLYYRGTYELDFLNYCLNNRININQGKRFTYLFENEDHYYFSDFYLKEKNLIIEIKSDYYWNKYLSKNLEKMKSVKDSGFDFLLILNKDYTEFRKIISEH
jgi:hypothetical protein